MFPQFTQLWAAPIDKCDPETASKFPNGLQVYQFSVEAGCEFEFCRVCLCCGLHLKAARFGCSKSRCDRR